MRVFYHVIAQACIHRWALSARLEWQKSPSSCKSQKILSSFLFGIKAIHSFIHLWTDSAIHSTLFYWASVARRLMNCGPSMEEVTLTGTMASISPMGTMKRFCEHWARSPPGLGLSGKLSKKWELSWLSGNEEQSAKFGWNKWKKKGISGRRKSTCKDTEVGKWWVHGAKQESKALPRGSGVPLNVMNWMLFGALKERNTVPRLLNSPVLPPNFKTCFHMYLIPYWEGSIVLCSPGNAP